MDAFQILVIILSVLLAIFLIIGITILVMVYRLVRTLREVTVRGGRYVDRAEEIGMAFATNAGAISLLRMLMKFITNTSNNKRRK